MRVPAQCPSTGEPVLISAVLIQVGKLHVKRNLPDKVPAIDEVQVTAVKVMMYRDQVDTHWEDVVRSPIKHIMHVFPQLSVSQTLHA